MYLSPSWITALLWQRGLHNPMKLLSHAIWGHPTWMGHSEEFWQNVAYWRRKWQPTPVFFPWEPHEQYEKEKIDDTGRWVPRPEGIQYATGEEWRAITNSSRKNDVAEPKQKCHSVVDVSGDENKVQCCKEQYCIGMLGSWIKVNWTWSSRRDKNKHQHLRNQWIKMNRNGRI